MRNRLVPSCAELCLAPNMIATECAQCMQDQYLLSSASTQIFIFNHFFDIRKWFGRNLSAPFSFPFALKCS